MRLDARDPEPAESSYVTRNRAEWDRTSEEYQALHGAGLGRGAVWGMWHIPEDELRILGDVEGKDVLEFGCGAADWSIALAKRGARAVGIDLSPRRLAIARERVAAAGVAVRLVEGNAEHSPFPDASFDVVFADHGATTFADPYRYVPEAARLLRYGGVFAFNAVTTLSELVRESDGGLTDQLMYDYFDIHTIDQGDDGVSFVLGTGDWIRLFMANGFLVEDYRELRAPENGKSTYADNNDYAWARRWPFEAIWKVRRVGE